MMDRGGDGPSGGSDRDRPDLAGGYALQGWLVKFAWAWASAHRSARGRWCSGRPPLRSGRPPRQERSGWGSGWLIDGRIDDG
jgi:hypothetical protein